MGRRYHWLSDDLTSFVNEPHSAIASDHKSKTLNLVAKESNDTRKISTQLAIEKPEKVLRQYKKILELNLPKRELIEAGDIKPENLKRILLSTYEQQPKNFETLLSTPGVGPRTIRALALISELIYDAPASKKDPVKYSFAHGGKDGTPYPVDKKTYDKSIEILKFAVEKAKIGDREKIESLKRLQFSLFK